MHQWLPELAMAGADRLGGLPALVWLSQAAITAVAVGLYLLCRGRGGRLAAAVAAALATLGAAGSLSPRPQVVGLVFLAIVVSAWLKTSRDLVPRWWLVPLSWIWACSHGTWTLGVLLGAVVTLTTVLDRRPTRAQVGRLCAIPALSLAAALATPVGPRLLDSVFAVNAVSPYIEEWRRPSLTNVSTIAVLVLAAMAVAGRLRSRETLDWTGSVLLVFGLVWALWHERTVSVGAVVIAPLAASALDVLMRKPRDRVDGPERWALAGATTVALLVAGLLAIQGPSRPAGVPDAFDGQLDRLPAGAVVFNDESLGGWLMYVHPDLEHTFDTRIELYGPQAIEKHLGMMNAAPGWTETFEQLHPRAALVKETARVVGALEQRGWTISGRDAGYVLLEPSLAR
jgi:hypothetical protein